MKNRKNNIKITELHFGVKNKRGRIHRNNKILEPHENSTLECLAKFGFDVEAIVPSNIPKSRNPDILMLGTFWEMKAPTTTDIETIATHFRKAAKQSGGRAIFDLRNIHHGARAVEQGIIRMFQSTRGMRRIMIIKCDNDEKEIILDISK